MTSLEIETYLGRDSPVAGAGASSKTASSKTAAAEAAKLTTKRQALTKRWRRQLAYRVR